MDGTATLRAEYLRLSDALHAIRDGLADVTVTAESPDGLITVTVNGRGELMDLELTPRVLRSQDSRALADAILRTVRAAARRADDEAGDLAERLLFGHGD